MDILTFKAQVDNSSGGIFAIYNAHPGDFHPDHLDVENFSASSLRFEGYSSDYYGLDKIVSFSEDLSKEDRRAILARLHGKDSPVKLCCCDLSDQNKGVKLVFALRAERFGDGYVLVYTNVYLRSVFDFAIVNPITKEKYQISAYNPSGQDDCEPPYSYYVYVEDLETGLPTYALRIEDGVTVTIYRKRLP